MWEQICRKSSDITERMAVPGGWLVCRVDGSLSPRSMVMEFVADPAWDWNLEEFKNASRPALTKEES